MKKDDNHHGTGAGDDCDIGSVAFTYQTDTYLADHAAVSVEHEHDPWHVLGLQHVLQVVPRRPRWNDRSRQRRVPFPLGHGHRRLRVLP